MTYRSDNSGRVFRDRRDAGRELGQRLLDDQPQGDLIVLGLPRGGVPVAYEVAAALRAPLDVLVVRKLGAPFNPELAVGGIALGGISVYNEDLLIQLGLDEDALEPIRAREHAELERRERAYRGNRPPPRVEGKTVIVVDDGIATGATMYAAVQAVRQLGPRKIIVAVPTSSADALRRLSETADEIVALTTPEPYIAVGAWYQYFDQVRDSDVTDLLAAASEETAGIG